MSTLGLIPARYASSRFPGKPLAEIAGRPMIEWVYRGAQTSKLLDDLRIATDDVRIAEVCRNFGARVEMTRTDHPSGSDRLAEVAARVECDLVVNIQGDEPTIAGFVIDAAVRALADDPDAVMSTVIHRAPVAALSDPNRVKVVLDRWGHALYFSRAPIPWRRERAPSAPIYQHVGLYAYRRDFLLRFVELAPTPLERAEQLEQLRVLEHGHRIRAALVQGWESCPVDVRSDVDRAEKLLSRSNSGT